MKILRLQYRFCPPVMPDSRSSAPSPLYCPWPLCLSSFSGILVLVGGAANPHPTPPKRLPRDPKMLYKHHLSAIGSRAQCRPGPRVARPALDSHSYAMLRFFQLWPYSTSCRFDGEVCIQCSGVGRDVKRGLASSNHPVCSF